MHVYSADCGVLCCVLHSSCVCVSCIVRWSSVTRHILVEVSEALLLFQSPSTLLVVAGASRPSFFFPPVATCTGTKETKKRLGNALARFPTIRFHGGITGELQRISALFWSRAGVVFVISCVLASFALSALFQVLCSFLASPCRTPTGGLRRPASHSHAPQFSFTPLLPSPPLN